jgi:hypothetical protein
MTTPGALSASTISRRRASATGLSRLTSACTAAARTWALSSAVALEQRLHGRGGAELAEAATGRGAHASLVVVQRHAQGGDALVLAADVAEGPRGGDADQRFGRAEEGDQGRDVAGVAVAAESSEDATEVACAWPVAVAAPRSSAPAAGARGRGAR